MRVAAGSGGPVDSNSDLLREVKDAIRSTADEPTVVQAIKQQTERIINELHRIAQSGGFGGNTTGGAPPTGREGGGRPEDQERSMARLLEGIERAVAALEGLGAERREGGGHASYWQTEAFLDMLPRMKSIFVALEQGTLNFKNVTEVFAAQRKANFRASVEDLIQSFMGATLNATNLSLAFRNLHFQTQQQLIGLRESGVFGSNMLSPVQFFLEGLTRVREGIFTTSDSFRHVVDLVKNSMERDILSPLFMTGKAASELAVDLHEARRDIRERFGVDTRAWMSTREANETLTSMLELQMKFGVQSQYRDLTTETMMGVELNYLKTIAAMTGQTVGKLEEQLRSQRAQSDVLVGMGRLNQQELQNFGLATKALEALGPTGKSVSDMVARLMAYGRTPAEILSNPAAQDFRTMAATQPELWRTLMQLMDRMTRKTEPSEIIRIVSQMGGRTGGADFQAMGPLLQSIILGPLRDEIARAVVAGNIASAKPAADAAEMARRTADPVYGLIQRMTEIWQEQIAPLMRLETAIGVQIIALGANTAALLTLAAQQKGIGLGSMLAGVGRIAGPIAGGAVAAGAAYASGAPTAGVAGAGVGGVAGGIGGAMLGSLAGPVGTMIGMAAGSALGGWLGRMIGEDYAKGEAPRAEASPATPPPGTATNAGTPIAPPQQPPVIINQAAQEPPAVPPPRNVFGPETGTAAVDSSRTNAYQDSTVNLLSKLVFINEDGNTRLGQIYGELSRQTSQGGGDGAPSATPPMGLGLRASGVTSRSMLGRPDDSTPYV